MSCKAHLPPEAQAFFAKDRQWCATQAAEIGPSCRTLIERLLADNVLERLRAAQGVLSLLKPYGAKRLEAACARALAHDSPHYRTVKTILSTKADLQGAPSNGNTPQAYGGATRFTRPAAELFPAPSPTRPGRSTGVGRNASDDGACGFQSVSTDSVPLMGGVRSPEGGEKQGGIVGATAR